ncbi:uncharacterized protein LOC107689983 [Sinocyclocheilus anshuiensis]|uniref:uncharacterized protein LOC107689983 n=1 Tax=Sinocyclocheilus anshuiensis TaxID=1608454 RepID=UPI0007B9C642|nr:PREDICTED: uncharacterized protein LOC107689983 [Sinocyclocheilus anshuiensis]
MSKLHHGFELQLVPGGTLLFEGEKDHLIPSTSQSFLDSDFFVVAGRMIGHSFLHGGPCLTGLSPAIIHVLFGGSPETATIDILDCVDTDVRQVIEMLKGTGELSEEEKRAITDLAVSWDLPGVTSENRRWLLDKLLIHAMILERIIWPKHDEDSEASLEDTCRLAGFLCTFIGNSSYNILRFLMKFWTGWDVLPRSLDVEVVDGNLPKSSTCYQTLKLPSHYKDYAAFESDILAIWSSDYGFGMV